VPHLTGTGLTPAQANQGRYDQLNHAVGALEAHRNVSAYLDATHSAWLGVGDIAERLVKGGVQRAQGTRAAGLPPTAVLELFASC
jgi:endoglucanase